MDDIPSCGHPVLRWAVLFSLLALAAGGVTGCSREPSHEIQFWLAYRDRGLIAAAHAWERQHPQWHVVFGTNAKGLNSQKLMTAIVGGDPPQVVMQDRFTIGEWASRDAFLPLDDLLKHSGLGKDDFYDAAWQEATYRGKVYAIPVNIGTRALLYNKTLLRQAGFVDARGKVVPPRTWKELRHYAKVLTKRDPRTGLMTQLGFAPNYGNSWLYLYAWLNHGDFMSKDRKTITMDSPAVVEALKYMVTLYRDAGGMTQVNAFVSSTTGSALNPFLTGRLAMIIHGEPFLNTVVRFAPDLNFGVAPPPAPKGYQPTTWSGGESFAIPRGAAHVKQAFGLISFLMSDKGQDIWLRTNARYAAAHGRGFIPMFSARPDINQIEIHRYVDHDPNLPQRARAGMKVFMDLLDVTHYRPVTPVGQYMWDEQVRAIDLATRGVATPKQALTEATRKVQRRLDRILHDEAHGNEQSSVGIGAITGVTALVLLLMGLGYWAWARRKRGEARRDELWAAGIFMSPWLIGFMVLTAGPVIASLIFSFCRYDVLHDARWVGLTNYEYMVRDPLFWKSLANTAYMLMAVPLGLAVGLIIALMLNANVRGMKVYRTLFYLPAVVPVVAGSILWIWVLNPTNGLINTTIRLFGIHYEPMWLASPSWLLGSKAAIILMLLWGAGSSMVIWLAGLKGVPQHLYEAAQIDGAGPVRQFWNVTLPMLTPYVFFNLVMGTIGILQIFTEALVMTQGGPADSTRFAALYLFDNAFRYFQMGYASALAWVMLLIILVLTGLQVWSSKRWVYYEAN